MVRGHRILIGAVSAAAVLAFEGCSNGGDAAGQKEASADAATECVPLTEGYYLFQNGKFVAAPAPQVQVVERTVTAPGSWSSELEKGFAELGFPWMGLRVRDRIATLTGTAPDLAAKERAFAAGEAAIKGDATGGSDISLIVDAISVEGGEAGVGAGLAELSASDLSLTACQRAFVETMEGRNIEFELNKAAISPASARLLDAVSGVATLCSAYRIAIEGHTDSRGSDDYNLQLSQERADAVKQYLADRGVDVSAISATGYGETRPIDPAENPAAWAKNRRTQFTVSAR
ncbi:MAG: OmpA family protein [Hyphomonas sp.]|uniref:OmpA family protein n=1 Tax=Hyphomonas sp. TaxID=87 RepID=UPI003527A2F8